MVQVERWEVPAFSRDELNPKKTDYCVCIPVLNEGELIKTQLSRMSSFARVLDIIVADGGSTDGSLEIDFLRCSCVRTRLVKNGSGGLSAQIRMGMAYALTQGYAGIILMDGNNKDCPSSLPDFLRELEGGCDYVQGSRFIAGGKGIHTPWVRHLAIKYIHAPLISLSAGYHYTDTTNGFRAYSAKFLKDPRVAVFRDIFQNYELHYYLAIRAARLGYRIREIPVTRAYPKRGKVPTKIQTFGAYLGLLADLLRASLHCFVPKEKS